MVQRLAVPVPPGLTVIGQMPRLRDLSLAPSKHAALSRKTCDAIKKDGSSVIGRLERLELHLEPPPPKNTIMKDRLVALLDNLLGDKCKVVSSLVLRSGELPPDLLPRLLKDKLPALKDLQLRALTGLRTRHLEQVLEVANSSGRLKSLLLQGLTLPLEPDLEAVLAGLRQRLHLRIC